MKSQTHTAPKPSVLANAAAKLAGDLQTATARADSPDAREHYDLAAGHAAEVARLIARGEQGLPWRTDP